MLILNFVSQLHIEMKAVKDRYDLTGSVGPVHFINLIFWSSDNIKNDYNLHIYMYIYDFIFKI